MVRLGSGEAEVTVYTYKEGLLSRVAHDLKLAVTRFEIVLDGEAVRATFDPASLKVLAVMKGKVEDRGALSERDREEIEANIRGPVLHVDRFPEIRFEGTVRRRPEGRREGQVEGRLTLCGVSRDLVVPVSHRPPHLIAKARLDQRNYGIEPFRAFMGALKIRPDVDVQVRLPEAMLA